MTGLLVDFRSASRQLVRNRGLSVVALASLAVGVGVSVSITSISTSVLVRSLPYQRPEDLVMVWGAYEPRAELAAFWDSRELARGVLTPARVQQWRDRHPFEGLAVLESWQTSPWLRADLIDGRKVESLRGTFATANIFGLLGVRPALGRAFVDGETDVAVISDSLWRRRFGADPGIVGRAVTLEIGRLRERRPVSILGVLPPGVRFTYPEETELWMPLTWADIASYPGFALTYRVVARLRGDVPLERAEAALEAFRDRTARNSNADRVWLEPMHDYAVGTSRRMLLLISALGLLVLLSGAVNASTVFAASAVSRIREMRVRRSLGASQRRLLRQVFVEAALVALIAGAVGLGTIAAALPAMRALLPPGTPGTEAIGLDWLTLSGVAGAAALSTLVAGVIPAWLSVRDREHRQLEDTQTATTSKSGVRLRGALVGVQFALVSALLIAGSMLVTSFWNLMHVDKGFEADERVYVTQLELVNNAYRNKSFDRYERELLRRVRELDYVQAATVTSAIPLRGRDVVNRIRRPDGHVIHVNARHVDPGYFNVMGMRLLNGRLLTEADANPNSWVAVVSQSLAEQLYPGGNSVGKFLEGNSGTEIVGVVADVRARSLLERPNPAYYWPRALATTNRLWLMVRTGGTVRQLAFDLERIVGAVYPGQPMGRVTTLSQILDDSVADRRISAVIGGTFAAAMLVLSALGLCGHLSHAVAQRRRELAIRSALGASFRQQLAPLLGHVVPALCGGLAVGISAVFLSYPLLTPFLFGVSRLDEISCAIAVVLLASFAAASIVPAAVRLSRLDPANTLRSI